MASNHFTSAKEVHCVADHGSDAGGKASGNLAQQLQSLFKRLKGGADYFYTKLHTLESCIIDVEGKPATFFAEVEEYPCAEKGRTIQIDLVSLLGDLPGHMMPMLASFDPSNPQAVQCSLQETSHGFGLAGYGFKENGPEVKRTPSPSTDWVNLQARAVTCSQSTQPGGGKQPLVKGMMEVLNVFLCKSLGSTAAGALHTLLGSEASTLFNRGVDWMRVAVHLFHCTDRVAFLTTVVRRKPGCAEELHHESQGLAMEAIAAVTPLARPLLIRMFRYLRTCFEIVREKIVSDLAVQPRDARGEARLAEATDGTRAVAYQLAMAHEVVERWVQAAPMHALLRQPRLPPSGGGADQPAKPDCDDESAVDPSTDCIVSAVLEMAFAGVALLLPEADAKGRRIFSLAYEDPPARDPRQLLGAATPVPAVLHRHLIWRCMQHVIVKLEHGRSRQELLVVDCLRKKAQGGALSALRLPTSVVEGDVELLVSRALLVFYMTTSALRPLLTDGNVGADWERQIGGWYLPFTACAYCAMSFAEDVLQRRWAVTFGEPPRPRQEHEGQLTINSLRATAMLLATHGAVFCDPSPPEIFDKLHDAYQGLLSAMRTALLTPPETVTSAFGAGTIAQGLYNERGAVNIAPVDCYDPETGALVCLAGVNLAEVLREEIAAADLIDTASGRRRSAAAKARVPDGQLPALLQAKEVSLRVWQIIWSLVAFSMQGPGGKPLQDGLNQSALAQVLKASVERAMCARPPAEVWQQLPARMLTNIKCIATSASATEMQARGRRGPSRVQQEHRDVVAFILRFFQALREKMERETMMARYARGSTPAAITYPQAAPPMMPQAVPYGAGPAGAGYMPGAYPYPQMIAAGDPRGLMYPNMPRVSMHAQPRLSGRAVGLPPAGGSGELRQGRPHEVERDRDSQPHDQDARELDVRSRSRDGPAPEPRHASAPVRGVSSDLEGSGAPLPAADASGAQAAGTRSSAGAAGDAPKAGDVQAAGQPDGHEQRRLSSGTERDTRQVAAARQPFAFASSYPDLMPPQATANPMYVQTPQGYYMPPMNATLPVDVATGMPIGAPYLGAMPGHPLLHPAAAAGPPLLPINTPHPLSQELPTLRQLADAAAPPPPRQKHSRDAASDENQNQQHNV